MTNQLPIKICLDLNPFPNIWISLTQDWIKRTFSKKIICSLYKNKLLIDDTKHFINVTNKLKCKKIKQVLGKKKLCSLLKGISSGETKYFSMAHAIPANKMLVMNYRLHTLHCDFSKNRWSEADVIFRLLVGLSQGQPNV